MMRISLIIVAGALSLSACTDRSESYAVRSSDAYATLVSAGAGGYGAGENLLPTGLAGVHVNVSFESIPTDQTAYWKFTLKGKELARVNAVVEGDDSSSKVSFSYAAGEAAGDYQKIERQIKTYMPKLIAEAVDARIEQRPVDMALKNHADAQSAMASVGSMMKDVDASMNEAAKNFDRRDAERDAAAMQRAARDQGTGPMTDLSKYN